MKKFKFKLILFYLCLLNNKMEFVYEYDEPSEFELEEYAGIREIFKEEDDDLEDKIEEEQNDIIVKVIYFGKKMFGNKFDKKNEEQMEEIYDEIEKQENKIIENRDKLSLKISSKNEEFDQDAFECALNGRKRLFQIKILWEKARNKVITEIGEDKFYKLNREDKFGAILKYMINFCKFEEIIKKKYNSMMYELTKDRFMWIESMKGPIEHGGRAVLVTTTRRTAPIDRLIHSLPGGKQMDKKELQKIATHLDSYFKIKRDKEGNPTGIDIVNLDKENKSLEEILSKLNLEDDAQIDKLIADLEKMDIAEKTFTLKKDQVRALIRTLSLTPGLGEKYEIVKQLRVMKNQDKKIKKEDPTDLTMLGEYDPDFDPSVVGMKIFMWKPFTTPTGKKRPVDTEEIFKVVKKGTYVYILPEYVTIAGKSYYYIRRFYKFEDYLKSYQLNNVRNLKSEQKIIEKMLKLKKTDPELLKLLDSGFSKGSVQKAYNYLKASETKEKNKIIKSINEYSNKIIKTGDLSDFNSYYKLFAGRIPASLMVYLNEIKRITEFNKTTKDELLKLNSVRKIKNIFKNFEQTIKSKGIILKKDEKFLVIKVNRMILFTKRISKINEYFIEMEKKSKCEETKTKLKSFINDEQIKPFI